GSGTTCAVSHKMNRKYIGIEQMNYTEETTIERLKNVIKGEQSGVSKQLNWQGGGSFVYAELYRLNEAHLHAIQSCTDNKELEQVINRMKQSAYLNFKVDLEKVTTKNEDFNLLSLDEQKDVLIQALDMNQLYLNYSEIEDSQYDISDSVKPLIIPSIKKKVTWMSNEILHRRIEEQFNSLFVEPPEVPDYVQDNLSHPLRDYQAQALKQFIYTQELDNADLSFNHLLFHLATGSGKTLVLASTILYLFKEHNQQNFIFFVNSDAIIKKTYDNLTNESSSKYLFRKE